MTVAFPLSNIDAHTNSFDIALVAAMEAASILSQSSPVVPTIPEDQEVEYGATVTRGKSRQGTIGACDACRMRKVRCLANEDSRSSKCQRCTRAGRECVRTWPALMPLNLGSIALGKHRS